MVRLKQAVVVLCSILVALLIYRTIRFSPSTVSLELKTKDSSLTSSPDLYSEKSKKVTESNTTDNDSKPVVPNAASENDIVAAAKKVSQVNGTVLVTVINYAYMPLTYSWLCNTKEMNIHKTILIITTDLKSKIDLQRDWPEISVVPMDMPNFGGDQIYSHVGYIKMMVWRAEVLNAIIQAGIEIFIFEADSVWFANPIPEFQRMKGYDILVKQVAGVANVYNGGFMYFYSTEKLRNLWKEHINQMRAFGDRLSKFANAKYIQGGATQDVISTLIAKRFGSITVKELPLDIYASGTWYSLPEQKRNQSRPLVVLNNFVLGIEGKIARAKRWKHWFIHEDRTCDMELVRKTVY